MRFIELIAGIGGFSRGFEAEGWECIAHCEIEPYAQKILKKRWPDVPLFEDVTKITEEDLKKLGPIDVVCAGFPCQDFSIAGEQKGIGNESSYSRSSLFHEIIRICRISRPRLVILENVAALLRNSGWMGIILGEFAKIGYDVEWQVISARDAGAPHLRERVWIVAYPISDTDSNGCPASKERGSIKKAI